MVRNLLILTGLDGQLIFVKKNIKLNNFAILRPTNPFRSKSFIERAIKAFKNKSIDSVRGIEKTKIHPGKIWKLKIILLPQF